MGGCWGRGVSKCFLQGHYQANNLNYPIGVSAPLSPDLSKICAPRNRDSPSVTTPSLRDASPGAPGCLWPTLCALGGELLKGSNGTGPPWALLRLRAPGLDATAGYQAPEEDLVKFKEGVPNLRVPKRFLAKSARERRHCGPRPRGGGRLEDRGARRGLCVLRPAPPPAVAHLALPWLCSTSSKFHRCQGSRQNLRGQVSLLRLPRPPSPSPHSSQIILVSSPSSGS